MLNARRHPHQARLFCRMQAMVLGAAWRKAAALARRALHHKARVMDMGSGMGGFSLALHHQHLKVTGLERDPFVLEEAGRYLPRGVELLLAGEHYLPPGSFALVATSLTLHCQNAENAQRQIQEMRRLAPLGLIMDWQLAENHLALPLATMVRGMEFLGSSREHYANYKTYMKNGGLEGLLYSLKGEGRVLARSAWLGGILGCALVEWD